MSTVQKDTRPAAPGQAEPQTPGASSAPHAAPSRVSSAKPRATHASKTLSASDGGLCGPLSGIGEAKGRSQGAKRETPAVAVYARVSRLDQHPQNQIIELQRHVATRGWAAIEFVEHGVSGAKDRRPQFDTMMDAVRRGDVDVVVAWKLDRVGRNMRHLVTMLDELRDRGVGFVTIAEGIDTTTPAGRLVFGIFAAVAEFERERLRERTVLGLDRAKREGKRLGRQPKVIDLDAVRGMSMRKAAARLGVSVGTIQRCRRSAAV